MNVLPSAPTDDGAQQQQEQEQQQSIYPTHELAQLNAEDFRLKKINDLLKELSDEAEHYRQVAKKYKRTHSIVHRSAVGLGSLSVGLSSGALSHSPDRVRYPGQPRPCWRCYCLRGVLCGVYLCKQAAGTESDQAREDLHAGPGQTQLRQRAGFPGPCG